MVGRARRRPFGGVEARKSRTTKKVMSYRATYIGPDGAEHHRTFADRMAAEVWLADERKLIDSRQCPLTSGVQRTPTIRYEQVRADAAARDLRRKKTGHITEAAQRAKVGQIDDATQAAEFNDVLTQEADLVAGASQTARIEPTS